MTPTRAYVAACALAALTGCQRPPQGPITAGRFDADVRILSNGSAEVVEQVTGTWSGTETDFERVVSYDSVDGITFGAASVDGRELARDVADGVQVDVRDDRILRVRWTLPPNSNTPRTFVLRYVVVAASAVEGARGSLRLPVIPANRPYPIEAAHVSLTLPEASALFSGTGIAEAGWQVERRANGIVAERRGLPAAEAATLVAEFSIDPTVVTEPRWQLNQRWGQLMMPAFLSGGLFILVIGGGILWITRFHYPRGRAGDADAEERQSVRAGLENGGFVTIAVAVVSAAMTWFWLSHLGPWAMAVPGSVLIVGVVFVAFSRTWV